MANQTIKKLDKSVVIKPESIKAFSKQKSNANVDATDSAYTTFNRKAEEMKIFLSLNPIPEAFLKKK